MKRRLLVAIATSAVVGVGVPATPAHAQSLGGFQGSASGSALQVEYAPQGVLPLPSIVDIGAPDAVATISSGPATFAQASVLDPGDLLANPDALLTLFSSDYPSGTLPAYPFRISANSGFGDPSDESRPGPGLEANVTADANGSTARANTAASDAAPVASVGSLSATATTRIAGDTITVHSVTKASGITVLGLLSIDSVTTDLTAVSKGDGTQLSGGTKVVGAKIGGRAVTIDGDGVHQGKNAIPIPKSLGKSLNDALGRAGIAITVAAPTKTTSAASGRLAAGGLRIDFDNTTRSVGALAALFDLLPSIPSPIPQVPSVDDLLVAIQARHIAGVELGRGVVSLTTRGGGEPADEGNVDLPIGGDLSGDVGGFGLPDSSGIGTTLVPRLVPEVLGGSRANATTDPFSPFGAGIGGLLLVFLLAQPFLGEALARLSKAVLATGDAEHCDAEGT